MFRTTTRKVFGLQCCLQTSRTIALCITAAAAAGLSRVQDDDDEGQQTAEEHLRVQSFTELWGEKKERMNERKPLTSFFSAVCCWFGFSSYIAKDQCYQKGGKREVLCFIHESC